MKNGRNALMDVLACDRHLAPFLNIPCKENGFDIEGIAVRGEQVFLGLRGPVLRGWATILKLRVGDGKLGCLKLKSFNSNREKYHKHFLDLDGLGIRDLVFDRDDLLILAGPTMDLDGPVLVCRWPNATAATEADVITHDQLQQVLTLPFGEGVDHAEGITIIRRATKRPGLLVVYDSPAPSRLHEDGLTIDADVYRLSRTQNQNRTTQGNASIGRVSAPKLHKWARPT